ncbi:MAG: hypothetical protein QG610_2073 [Euryarchaeota archaeon]|nr:hypothetical protein [Euryarchaeota archaeon]
MVPEFSGVMAAPNQSEIKAKVLGKKQSPDFEDKFLLELEILDSKSLSGPNFAHIGENVKGFTFESKPELLAGKIITARAEFFGDERGGKFRLTQIRLLE